MAASATTSPAPTRPARKNRSISTSAASSASSDDAAARSAEAVEHVFQLVGQRRIEQVGRASGVERELHRRRMQEQALEPGLLGEPLVGLAIAVLLVARDRMAEMRRMHADLVRAPGL